MTPTSADSGAPPPLQEPAAANSSEDDTSSLFSVTDEEKKILLRAFAKRLQNANPKKQLLTTAVDRQQDASETAQHPSRTTKQSETNEVNSDEREGDKDFNAEEQQKEEDRDKRFLNPDNINGVIRRKARSVEPLEDDLSGLCRTVSQEKASAEQAESYRKYLLSSGSSNKESISPSGVSLSPRRMAKVENDVFFEGSLDAFRERARLITADFASSKCTYTDTLELSRAGAKNMSKGCRSDDVRHKRKHDNNIGTANNFFMSGLGNESQNKYSDNFSILPRDLVDKNSHQSKHSNTNWYCTKIVDNKNDHHPQTKNLGRLNIDSGLSQRQQVLSSLFGGQKNFSIKDSRFHQRQSQNRVSESSAIRVSGSNFKVEPQRSGSGSKMLKRHKVVDLKHQPKHLTQNPLVSLSVKKTEKL